MLFIEWQCPRHTQFGHCLTGAAAAKSWNGPRPPRYWQGREGREKRSDLASRSIPLHLHAWKYQVACLLAVLQPNSGSPPLQRVCLVSAGYALSLRDNFFYPGMSALGRMAAGLKLLF